MELGMNGRVRRKEYERINQMLEDAVSGEFEESDYDESELSKLEVKWKRYLASSRLSAKKQEEERKNIQALVTDISHQTKTPLSNILLYGQLLSEQNLDGESRELLNQILYYSGKLDFLIQSLVKTSRLEAGTFQFTPKKDSVCHLAELAASAKEEQAKARNMTLELQTDGDGTTAVFDSKWTQEAVGNILDNAIKYSPENTTVTIRVFSGEMFAGIEIRDRGAGIPEEEIPQIFARFYRGKHVAYEDGVGVGLFLAREIVEGQGGYIKVISNAGGSRFQVFLPR